MISVPVITLYTIQLYRQQIVQQMIDEEIENQPKRVYTKYVPVFLEDNRIYQGSDKPYIFISDFSARDYRGNPPYSLQISGKGINDGGGIAYNGVLHVLAMNDEGVALDAYHDFGGATSHVPFGFSFSLKYNSTSPITNCTITASYTDTNS